MKYKSEKTLRKAKKAFSLIELMIVIVIIGALTAIILPQFDISESEAKDAGCDASNYGTLSQLTKFRSLHGVYPSRMHTGFEAADWSSNDGISADIMGTSSRFATLASFSYANMDETNKLTDYVDLSSGLADSLREAGIISLAYGGFPTDSGDPVELSFAAVIGSTFNGDQGAQDSGGVIVASIIDNWYEAWTIDTSTGLATSTLDTDSDPITINGVPLPFYACNDPYLAYQTAEGDVTKIDITDTGVWDSGTNDGTDDDSTATTEQVSAMETDGIVVPLFIAPTVDWENWYDANGSANPAKVGVAQTGACPWLEGGKEFRYYIAVFKVYGSGDKAKLLGTMCPEGGSLNP